jgi:PAS domain S-box-containing protein
LRERFDELTLPILVLTASAERNDRREALAAGANDYVAKPYDDEELLARVRTLIRVRQQSEALRMREGEMARALRDVQVASGAIRAAEERYRTLFESIDEGYCLMQLIFDEADRPVDYRFLETNAAFEVHTGLRDAVGRTARELVPNLDGSWFEIYGRVAVTGQAVRFENEAPAMGRSFEVNAARVGHPELRQVALVFKDVTSRRAAEAERRELLAREQAARADAEAERARLTTILSTLAEGVILQDAQGVLRFSSAAAESLLGLTAEQMAGRTPMDPRWGAVRPDGSRYPGEEHPPMRALRTSRGVIGDVLGVRHPDGRIVWLSVNSQPIVAADGRGPTGVVTSFTDVTHQREAAAERERLLNELQVARRRMAVLFESAPAFICTLSGPEHVFELANPPYQRLVGAGRPLIGLPAARALPEVVAQGFIDLLDGVYRSGESYSGTEVPVRLQRTDGAVEDAFVNFVYQPTRDAAGEVVGIDVFGFDVTEQVRARQRAESLAEERKQLLEHLERGDACMVVDANWVCVFVNANLEKVVQRPRAELLGRILWDLFPADAKTQYETQLRRVMRDRVETAFEEFYAPLDLWTATTAYPTSAGGIVIFIRDVTERRRAEAEITMLAAVVEEAPDFIGVSRLDGTALFVNPAGRRLVGLERPERVRTTHVSEFFTAESWPEADGVLQEALRTGRSSREVNLRQFETREAIPVLWQVITITDPRTAEPIAFAMVTRDLREEKLRAADAERRATFEQQLLGIVSHDLRNPISAITMGAAVLLQVPELASRERRILERILNSAGRASRLIHDLLDFTQARLGGGLAVRPAPGDLHDVVRQAVEEAQSTSPRRAVLLEQSGDGAGTFDADRVAQLVGNLLSNALHYGDPQAPVRASTRTDAATFVIEVHNAGVPIAPDALPALFQPMQRGVSGVSQSRSVGLGLYIVEQLVRAHGGSIQVASTAEAGTTFTVRLPRAPEA